jgi:ribosomal protein L11 methyltransferase
LLPLHKNRNMPNSYIGYHFNIEPRELGSEILIAELGETAFESFTETGNLRLRTKGLMG